MSDDLKKRSTSFAKTVDGLVHEESALDRALSLKEEFERAKSVHEHAREQERPPRTQETMGTSHAPKPEPHLRPEGNIRRAVDRKIDNEKLKQAGQRAKELKDALKEHEQQHKPSLEKEWNKTRHRSR